MALWSDLLFKPKTKRWVAHVRIEHFNNILGPGLFDKIWLPRCRRLSEIHQKRNGMSKNCDNKKMFFRLELVHQHWRRNHLVSSLYLQLRVPFLCLNLCAASVLNGMMFSGRQFLSWHRGLGLQIHGSVLNCFAQAYWTIFSLIQTWFGLKNKPNQTGQLHHKYHVRPFKHENVPHLGPAMDSILHCCLELNHAQVKIKIWKQNA